ncbi:putative disease resistance RPP13-like protein 1 [Morus notabilis]|uniref:putative disease resistance RPP13-like protein 1 n=1 Tax=Morus notabilis TaxID=981085 RepID=UPI000CED027F|nr:putative disease resistance RPP13-like protein 1 [Morus notabilis]
MLFNDAEEKQLKDQNVKKWVDELKEVIYEADHLMDKVNYEALRGKIEGDESGSKLLLDKKDVLGLRECVRNRPPQRLLAPLLEECDVYGREVDKEAIVKLLLSDDASGCRISVIPIVGMGGVGKTTLAQLVYRDSRVQEHFDLIAWVTVSDDYDVLRITRIILEMITSTKCDVEDLYQLQDELKKALMGKRFLFVHDDDVWNENYNLWDLLKSPFQFGKRASKIIMTTRSKIAASKMANHQTYDLQTIPYGDCLRLFAKHVFDDLEFDIHSELNEIGTAIVLKVVFGMSSSLIFS